MQFKVPQDVQREDTIIGPLTGRQLIIMAIGGTIAYAIYITLAKNYFADVWLPPTIIVVAITLAFAFLKIHNLTFTQYLFAKIAYTYLPKKRIWQKGSALPQFTTYLDENKNQPKNNNNNTTTQNKKTLSEMVKIVDQYGKAELSTQEKKQELNKIINQNYK